ncbi:MAG TPA: DciA family protein [Stellaceae bacterium]|nr:DciA family protein [Stellaceae bacterium]
MAEREDGERRGSLRAVGQELPRVAGRILGKQGLGEAQLVSEWAAVVGAELAASTLPIRLSFPAGGRRNGTLKLRVTSAAALAVQHREPQILERINGFFGYAAVARLVLMQGPLPRQPEPASPPPRALTPVEAAGLAERLQQLPDSAIKSALHRLGAAILGDRRR